MTEARKMLVERANRAAAESNEKEKEELIGDAIESNAKKLKNRGLV